MQDRFKIFVFRAVNNPQLCESYLSGHAKVLKDFNIENVTSVKSGWVLNPNTYCVMLKSELEGELYGGIRIQIADGIHKLPVQDAISFMEPKIDELVKKYAQDGGVGELCGLWVDNSLRGLGMGPYLVRAAIASSIQLHFQTMIGICAKYSLSMFKNVGFAINNSLGNNGDFSYPNDKYVAHVVGILDAITLMNSNPYDRAIMKSLRKKPQHARVEDDGATEVRIQYDLIYPNAEQTVYEEIKSHQHPKTK